jgi:hypothetical protein
LSSVNRDIRQGSIFAIAIALACAIGVYMGNQRIWPLPQIKNTVFPDKTFGRLVSYPGKQNIGCPPQTRGTRVLLIAGQSNAANKGGQRYASTHGEKVINFFEGTCYVAQSPLLGSQGAYGEYWTLLGNALIQSGADQVILIPAAIFATPIRRWASGGDLNPMLLATVDSAKARYRVTDIVWEQGEEDFSENTKGADYTQGFRSVLASLRSRGVSAPIFVSIATKCSLAQWSVSNPIADAQRALPNAALRIYSGIDTDKLMAPLDRYDDCHLAASGQLKAASAWAKLLSEPLH